MHHWAASAVIGEINGGQEQAVRRGWLHFSGNDACILTQQRDAVSPNTRA